MSDLSNEQNDGGNEASGFVPPNQEPTAEAAAQHAAEAAARGESAPVGEDPYPADPAERQERTNSEMGDLSGGRVDGPPEGQSGVMTEGGGTSEAGE